MIEVAGPAGPDGSAAGTGTAGAGTVGTDGRPWDGVVITPMRRRHLRGVVDLERRTSHRPWTHSLFQTELRMPTTRVYVVARRAHRVLGFAGLMLNPDEGHITNVVVEPDERRAGIAARMLLVLTRAAIARGLDALTLEVRMSNRGAQELYRRFGFAPGGVRPNYYSDPREDALIMWAHHIGGPEGTGRLERIEAGLPWALVQEVLVDG